MSLLPGIDLLYYIILYYIILYYIIFYYIILGGLKAEKRPVLLQKRTRSFAKERVLLQKFARCPSVGQKKDRHSNLKLTFLKC